MIYQIDDKYYVNISPNIYVEIKLCLKKDELILVPTNNQREVNGNYKIRRINFTVEKEKLKEKIIKEKKTNEKNIKTKEENKKIKPRPLVGNNSFKKNKHF